MLQPNNPSTFPKKVGENLKKKERDMNATRDKSDIKIQN